MSIGKTDHDRGIATSDFTVVVRMGKQRQEDRFYIVPLGEISKRQTEHKQRGRKDVGMWRLSFKERKDGREAAGTGIEKKWGQYEGAWDLLDG